MDDHSWGLGAEQCLLGVGVVDCVLELVVVVALGTVLGSGL